MKTSGTLRTLTFSDLFDVLSDDTRIPQEVRDAVEGLPWEADTAVGVATLESADLAFETKRALIAALLHAAVPAPDGEPLSAGDERAVGLERAWEVMRRGSARRFSRLPAGRIVVGAPVDVAAGPSPFDVRVIAPVQLVSDVGEVGRIFDERQIVVGLGWGRGGLVLFVEPRLDVADRPQPISSVPLCHVDDGLLGRVAEAMCAAGADDDAHPYFEEIERELEVRRSREHLAKFPWQELVDRLGGNTRTIRMARSYPQFATMHPQTWMPSSALSLGA